MFCLSKFLPCLLILALGVHSLGAQEDEDADRTQPLASTGELDFEVGIEGTAKLGSWLPVFIESAEHSEATRYEVSVLDGDDQLVTYSGQLMHRAPGSFEARTRLGRQYGNITVRLLDDQNKILAEKTSNLGSLDSLNIVPSTHKLILALEPGDTVFQSLESVISSSSKGDSQVVLGTNVTAALPSSWLNWESISTVVLTTSDLALIQSVTQQQWQAIDQWVRNGGKLVFCGGENGQSGLEADGLGRFLPGTLVGNKALQNSWQLEAFANSREQLLQGDDDSLVASVLNPVIGVVDKTQDDIPLIVRTARGFGLVVYSAVDLDQGPVAQWPGRNAFIAGLLDPASNADPSTIEESQNNRFSHFGYDDLTGQLKVPLEQFSGARFVTFTWVAVLIGLYILCIGPGDYFLLRNVFGKMELTWLTFPLITLTFCGIAVVMAWATRPTSIQVNQLEIIDIDAIDNTSRGNLWANVFSPTTSDCQVQMAASNPLGFDTRTNSTVIWQGLPGSGLGGMQTRTGARLFRREYRCEFETSGEGDSPAHCTLSQLPLQVSSTKPLFVQWYSNNPFKIQSRLKVDPQFQRLEGTITNPLQVSLHNCRLMFENWTYELNDTLEPGETIDIETETKEKTAKNFLTRRKRESNKGKNSPWNPADARMWRIADMLMFYELAGGRGYTKLSHDYQSQVDMSQQLNLGRAMLVGEIRHTHHGSDLEISDRDTDTRYDNVTTIVRIILPVEFEGRNQ
ncbi:MAG: hypothetical protein VYE64_08235 [Planctomycetota bacterium]|nr:hypothetical protein [Planctomycetota bacterium]